MRWALAAAAICLLLGSAAAQTVANPDSLIAGSTVVSRSSQDSLANLTSSLLAANAAANLTGNWSLVPMLLAPDSEIQQLVLRAEPVRGGYYIIILFQGAINFDGVIYKAAAPAGLSMAVLRIDKTCELIWAVGGSQGLYRIGEGLQGSLSRNITGASVNPLTGDLWIVGNFGLDDMVWGSLSVFRDTAQNQNPHAHCFLVALSYLDGHILWVEAFHGDTLLQCQDISHDSQGNAFVSGRCVGTCTFGSQVLATQAWTDVTITGSSYDGPYQSGFSAFILSLNSTGGVKWVDHLDAAEGVDINSTMLASDAGTNLTTVAATMTAFDPATGLETASAISLLAVYGNGTRHLMSTPFTATNESGVAAFVPAFSLAGCRAVNGVLYLAATVQGNLTLDTSFAVSNVTVGVQGPHDCSSRGLIAAFSIQSLQAQWLTVLSSNDSSLGATITHIDIEDDADQMYLVGSFSGQLGVGSQWAALSMAGSWADPSDAESLAAPVGYLGAVSLSNGTANWTQQYAGYPQEVTIVNRQYQTSTWSTVLWGQKSGGVRHLHVAGLGWNVNASGQLNGSYWGMQSPYDGHVVQIQMPMSNTAETIWGMKPQNAAMSAFAGVGCGTTLMITVVVKVALGFLGI